MASKTIATYMALRASTIGQHRHLTSSKSYSACSNLVEQSIIVVKGKRGTCTQGCSGTLDNRLIDCYITNLFTLACLALSSIKYDTKHLMVLESCLIAFHVGGVQQVRMTLGRSDLKSYAV